MYSTILDTFTTLSTIAARDPAQLPESLVTHGITCSLTRGGLGWIAATVDTDRLNATKSTVDTFTAYGTDPNPAGAADLLMLQLKGLAVRVADADTRRSILARHG